MYFWTDLLWLAVQHTRSQGEHVTSQSLAVHKPCKHCLIAMFLRLQ